ncbi:hypothetical protein R1flu_021678 [Riccia fluitans]|uniref:Uncharacterized protein n=1 Tax=Riccia fluitans TaxID=41844 RepID=A0ABD1ZQ33_9MARC
MNTNRHVPYVFPCLPKEPLARCTKHRQDVFGQTLLDHWELQQEEFVSHWSKVLSSISRFIPSSSVLPRRHFCLSPPAWKVVLGRAFRSRKCIACNDRWAVVQSVGFLQPAESFH